MIKDIQKKDQGNGERKGDKYAEDKDEEYFLDASTGDFDHDSEYAGDYGSYDPSEYDYDEK